MRVSCLVVTSRRSRDRKRDYQLQTTQMLEASCLFSFKSILLRTSGKCQSINRTACMLNFIYIVQSKWYLRLKISVQGPFKHQLTNLKGILSLRVCAQVLLPDSVQLNAMKTLTLLVHPMLFSCFPNNNNKKLFLKPSILSVPTILSAYTHNREWGIRTHEHNMYWLYKV